MEDKGLSGIINEVVQSRYRKEYKEFQDKIDFLNETVKKLETELTEEKEKKVYYKRTRSLSPMGHSYTYYEIDDVTKKLKTKIDDLIFKDKVIMDFIDFCASTKKLRKLHDRWAETHKINKSIK